MTGSTGQGQPKSRPKNEPSVLLTNAENEVLYSLLGPGRQTLASAVVQVYLADPPSRNRWNKRCCGVATFIKDNPKKSYFIKVYDIRAKHLLWEQELYNQFKYKTPRPYFHTFDTDDCPAGLNFSNEDEAQSFNDAVSSKLQQRMERKMERRKTVQQRQQAAPVASNNNQAPKTNLSSSSSNLSASTNSLSSIGGTLKKNKDKKGKKAKLTKEDIGTPTDFRHVSHVGWDPDSGYDMNNLDPDLKTLFDQIGVNESQLKDKETAKFIYDFIEQKGGIDAVKKEVETKSRPLPPPPVGGAPPPPPARGPPSRGGPPPPPSRSNAPPPPPVPKGPPPGPGRMGALPPAPPSRGGPPPPPISRPGGPPPPPVGGGGPPPPPPPPPIGGGPPPPPPPPIAGGGPAPPAPPPVKPSGGGMNMALMDQIHHGTKLKHVDGNTESAPGTERDALLEQIRGGAALRPVSASSSSHSVQDTPSDDDSGIAGALARALASRGKHIHVSDDEDSDDDSDDDEFDADDWE